MGGAFPYSARRAIRYGDGWIPQAARGMYKEIADMIPEFRKMATEAGRDPATIAITVWFPRKDADLMKRYMDLGVERVVFNLESEAADKIMPEIEDRQTLYVAVLLHDIAKGRQEDHSVAGAKVARKLCPRLGLSPKQTEMVAWLIDQHLLMSMVAQTRDLHDGNLAAIGKIQTQAVAFVIDRGLVHRNVGYFLF